MNAPFMQNINGYKQCMKQQNINNEDKIKNSRSACYLEHTKLLLSFYFAARFDQSYHNLAAEKQLTCKKKCLKKQ